MTLFSPSTESVNAMNDLAVQKIRGMRQLLGSRYAYGRV